MKTQDKVVSTPQVQGSHLPKEQVRGKNYRYIHTECSNTAFYLTHLPKAGEKFMASNVVNNDGSYPKEGEKVVCGSCRKDITYLSTENIVQML